MLKNLTWQKLVIAQMVLVIFLACVLYANSPGETRIRFTPSTTVALEYAYAEGQKDAINGDIRVERNGSDDCYKWVSSPWDDGKVPKLNLCKEE